MTKLQNVERKSYWKYTENLIEVGEAAQDYQPKQKRFFSFMKSLRRDNSGIAPLKRLYVDPKEKADILSKKISNDQELIQSDPTKPKDK